MFQFQNVFFVFSQRDSKDFLSWLSTYWFALYVMGRLPFTFKRVQEPYVVNTCTIRFGSGTGLVFLGTTILSFVVALRLLLSERALFAGVDKSRTDFEDAY